MNWDIMDARYMTYENNFFDVIIDKGTTDAILCANDPAIDMARVYKEATRILKTGGYYVVLSYEGAYKRMIHFN